MHNFLLEIGTEELPAELASSVIPQLKEAVALDLRNFRVKHGLITCTTTPRRIALIINELAVSALDFVQERKGPPYIQAYKNDEPTNAAIGFAKKNNLSVNDLEVRDTPKGKFLFARTIEKGRPINKILIERIPMWIESIQGNRFMRWGQGEVRFSRPIRWLIAMLDDQLLPVFIKGTDPLIKSTQISKTHRMSENEEVKITNANAYLSSMLKNNVNVDRDKRYNMIERMVREKASSINAIPDLTNKIIDELTDLVESPSIFIGGFDKSYLDLPPEVLSTVMRVHQRYIPLYIDQSQNDILSLDSKKILFPNFLCITNTLAKSKDLVRSGNERVLRARFSDAKFFIQSDLAISSEERCEKLKKVSFSEGLGSLFNRVQRIQWITDKLIQLTDSFNINKDNLNHASLFCKHDLVSNMVGEFPELQGVIGAKYLLKEGHPKELALAVFEHYLPRFSGDSLPSSQAGSLLALAERFELLLSIFAKGERPTGSSDPYALRRAANGILQIIWSNNLKLDIHDFLIESVEYWSQTLHEISFSKTKLIEDLSDFFRQRIISLFEEIGEDSDLIKAVAGNTTTIQRLLKEPCDSRIRLDLLRGMRSSGELSKIQSVVNRASRLAEKSNLDEDTLSAKDYVDVSLFEKDSEHSMLDLVNSLEKYSTSRSVEAYMKIAQGLACSIEALSEFFDGQESVMVMTEDKARRENRLNLLAVLTNQSKIIADFTKINSV